MTDSHTRLVNEADDYYQKLARHAVAVEDEKDALLEDHEAVTDIIMADPDLALSIAAMVRCYRKRLDYQDNAYEIAKAIEHALTPRAKANVERRMNWEGE